MSIEELNILMKKIYIREMLIWKEQTWSELLSHLEYCHSTKEVNNNFFSHHNHYITHVGQGGYQEETHLLWWIWLNLFHRVMVAVFPDKAQFITGVRAVKAEPAAACFAHWSPISLPLKTSSLSTVHMRKTTRKKLLTSQLAQLKSVLREMDTPSNQREMQQF